MKFAIEKEKQRIMEFGIMTFADMAPETLPGKGYNGRKRMTELMEEIKLADELGLDVAGIGEHHRTDYAVSSPTVALGAAAAITKNIKLTSAVTVLSSDDPVRVFQQFAEVDLISGGRAEIMAGRGSFIESFPLFGQDLKDYDSLFAEKLELLLKINSKEKISWSGKHRPALQNLGVYPRPYNEEIPVWIAVGGTPASAERAAILGLPLMLAIIGGYPRQFAPFIKYYRETFEANHPNKKFQVGINNHFFVADSSEKAGEDFFPHYKKMMDRVGKDRGWSPITRAQFEGMRSPEGSLTVGSVEEVVDKIVYQHGLFGFTRFLVQSSLGTTPHELNMRSIELFATKVVPAVKERLGVLVTD